MFIGRHTTKCLFGVKHRLFLPEASSKPDLETLSRQDLEQYLKYPPCGLGYFCFVQPGVSHCKCCDTAGVCVTPETA